MDKLVSTKYPIPTEIFIREDRILYHDKHYLILDGINIEGEPIEDGFVSVYYRNNGDYYHTICIKSLLQKDKRFFFSYMEGVFDGMDKGI